MANFVDWLAGRKSMEYGEGEGLELALRTAEEFDGRTFKCRGRGARHSRTSYEEILRFIQKELPDYYNYTTRVKKYIDRRGIPQVQIEIAGSMGLSRQLNRYNPLDMAFFIKTESPAPSRGRQFS